MAAINAKERQEIKEYIEHTGKYEYIGILIREVEYRKNNEDVVLFRDKEDGTLCFITYREYKSMKKAEEQGYDYVLLCYPLELNIEAIQEIKDIKGNRYVKVTDI